MSSARWLALWSILTCDVEAPVSADYHPHPRVPGREPVSLSLPCVSL